MNQVKIDSLPIDSAQVVTAQADSSDVIIVGGGLAGLTLALQLRQANPDVRIIVLERKQHPVSLAAHKVGESSVELAANYFANVLGLKDHLMNAELKKFGFRFFFSDRQAAIDKVTELGARTHLTTPSYQIDRGVFENYLAQLVQEKGVQFLDACVVKTIDLAASGSQDSHAVIIEQAGQRRKLTARWLLDASGRAGMLKRKLDLAEPSPHKVNAVWFRVKGHVNVNDWSNNEAWKGLCNPPRRWLSTNHLCGEGYWLWLIPLASGAHSIGIVADPDMVPLEQINTHEKAMAWIAEHQPQLWKDLQPRELLDFAFFKHFAFSAKKVYDGAQRWALTGEAGVFLDPFYSPGSDYIAMGNTFITELVSMDRRGQPTAQYARMYERVFFQFYEGMLPLYLNQYRLFGDPKLMTIKVLWDYCYYWGVMCPLFNQGKLTDLRTMSLWQAELAGSRSVSLAVQDLLREWGNLRAQQGMIENPATMLDHSSLDWVVELNRGLEVKLDDEALKVKLRYGFDLLNAMANEIIEYVQAECPSISTLVVQTALATLESSKPAPSQAIKGRLLFEQLYGEQFSSARLVSAVH